MPKCPLLGTIIQKSAIFGIKLMPKSTFGSDLTFPPWCQTCAIVAFGAKPCSKEPNIRFWEQNLLKCDIWSHQNTNKVSFCESKYMPEGHLLGAQRMLKCSL